MSDEDLPAEILLHRSAPYRPRSSPWESVPVTAERPSLPAPALHWWNRAADAVLGWVERHRPVHWGPSRRTWHEVMDYFSLHAQEGPCPVRFRRLLKRNGLPDWANPFPEGAAEHYTFHPLGLLAADVSLILEAWTQKNLPHSDAASEEEGLKKLGDGVLWPTLSEAAAERWREQRQHDRQARAQARVCWAMVLMAGAPWRLRDTVHPENLVAATLDAVLRGDLASWGLSPQQVWTEAVRHGIVPPRNPNELWTALGGPDAL